MNEKNWQHHHSPHLFQAGYYSFDMLLRALFILCLTLPGWADESSLKSYAQSLYAERKGALNQALEHNQTALQADPESYRLHQRAADLHLQLNQLPQASQKLRSYAQKYPLHLLAQLRYVDFLLHHSPQDRIAQKLAIETLEKSLRHFPDEETIGPRLFNLYEKSQQREKAHDLFTKLSASKTTSPAYWHSLLPLAYRLYPDPSEKLRTTRDRLYEKALQLGIRDSALVRQASEYYRTTQRIEKGIEILENHLTALPSSLSLRTRLAILLFSTEKDELALAHLHEILEIDPKQALAHATLAKYYTQKNEPAKALPHRAQVLKLRGGDKEDFLQVAQDYLDAGQAHPARLLLEKARFHHPDDPAVTALLAQSLLLDGQSSQATLLFQITEKLARESNRPKDQEKYLTPDFHLHFAHTLIEAQLYEAAEDRLRTSLKMIPADQPKKTAKALRSLANLWKKQGKNESAAQSLIERAENLEK